MLLPPAILFFLLHVLAKYLLLIFQFPTLKFTSFKKPSLIPSNKNKTPPKFGIEPALNSPNPLHLHIWYYPFCLIICLICLSRGRLMATQCWAQCLDLVLCAKETGQPDLVGGKSKRNYVLNILKEIIFLVDSSQSGGYV